MNVRDLLRLVWANINRMRGRAIMTGLGVVIGTAAIVVLIALASGLRESAAGDLSQFGPVNQITVRYKAAPEADWELVTLIQRDYHAENLLWLPERSGVARVGLLDFQDAMLGHPAYDLVSILQDARRDVPKLVEAAMIDRYLAQQPQDPEAFRAAYAILGVQRNLRIVGAFAKLCLHVGKPRYVDLLPRVWEFVERNLAHPALEPVALHIRETLPAPTPAIMDHIRSQCAK